MELIIVGVIFYFGWKFIKNVWRFLSLDFLKEYYANKRAEELYIESLDFLKKQQVFNRNDLRSFLENRKIFITNEEDLTKIISLLSTREKITPFNNIAGVWQSTYDGPFETPIERNVINLD